MEDKHVKTVIEFAKNLIDEVRDETIKIEHNTMLRPFGSKGDKELHEITKTFNDEQKKALLRYICDTTDATIFHFFRMLDEHDEYDLVIRKGKKEVLSIKEISDGVYGDMLCMIEDKGYGKYPVFND